MTVKSKLRVIYGQAGATWIIDAETEEEAKNECKSLIERFRPKITPDDEYRDFRRGKSGSYVCTYEYRYARRRRALR